MNRPLKAAIGALLAVFGYLATLGLSLPEGAGVVFAGSWAAFMVASLGTAYFDDAKLLWVITMPMGAFLLMWTPLYVGGGFALDVLTDAWRVYSVGKLLALTALMFTAGWFSILAVRR